MKFLLLIAFSLAGCVSTIEPVNMEPYGAEDPNKALVYFISKGADSNLFINWLPVAGMAADSYTWGYLEPGGHNITFNHPGSDSRVLGGSWVEVEAGKTYYLQYAYRYNPYKSELENYMGDTGMSGSLPTDYKNQLSKLTDMQASIPLGTYKLLGNTLN